MSKTIQVQSCSIDFLMVGGGIETIEFAGELVPGPGGMSHKNGKDVFLEEMRSIGACEILLYARSTRGLNLRNMVSFEITEKNSGVEYPQGRSAP